MDYYVLPDDRAYAEDRIAALEAEIAGLGPEFNEVFTQTSETWHDNGPFDALRDKQSQLDAERQYLRRILQQAMPKLPRVPRGKVGIGDTVTLSGGLRYLVAGDWTHRAGHQADGIYTVSCRAPIAGELLGKKVGDSVSYGKVAAVIEAIEKLA